MPDKTLKEKHLLPTKACRNTVQDKTVTGEVVSSFDELRLTRREWDSFVQSVGGDIFSSYDWCRIWWRYYGKNRDLRIYVFRYGNKLVGIIPLFFETLQLGPIFVRVAKIVGSDFTLAQFSLPIRPGYPEQVIPMFFELLSKDNWDVVHIGPVAGMYQHYDDFRSACEHFCGNSHHIVDRNKGVQIYFRLADDWESYLGHLSKNERGNIRRSYNVIKRNSSNGLGYLNSCFAGQNNFAKFFDDFIAMHELHWRTLGKPGHFKDWPSGLEFHRELAQTNLSLGRLRLLRVAMGSNCLGYQYHYKFGDKYYHFLDARSDPSVLKGVSSGRIAFCEQLKKAILEGVQCIDSMRGKYEHKLRLGGQLLPMKNLYIIPKKLTARMGFLSLQLTARFIDLCYYRGWYCRIAPKLSIRYWPLWQIWIRTSAFA